MKLLINDKEIAHFLLSLIDYTELVKSIGIKTENIDQVTLWINYELAKPKYNLDKMRKKFKDRIYKAVKEDLKIHISRVIEVLEIKRAENYEKVHKNIEFFIEKLGENTIFELYQKNNKQDFVKSVGFKINPNSIMLRRKKFTDFSDDCLIRNTVGNEQLLISKVNDWLPFWFIDSGYTNFLETSKKWHRLERNHLHYGKFFEAPVDRLGIFKNFPQQWRESGEKILVIEPGPLAAGIFHVNLSTWKYNVEAELRKYTDKPIVFREKAEKRVRTNLYQELCNEDYYCVVNINSNAATEAIWAGIPAITLDQHVTNPVTRNQLSDINNLLRPNLATWLCMLSYSQWTYDELINGIAVKLVKKYHV